MAEDKQEAADKHRELKDKAVKGTFWTGGGQIVRQVVQILTSVMLARLLVPEDFGLLAMAMVFVGVAQLIADFGIGAAVVQRDEVPERLLSSCFWLNLIIAGLLSLLVALFAGVIAGFYGNPKVEPVLQILSVNLIIGGLIVLPRALLYRRMDFQSIAIAQLSGTTVGSAVAVVMAWNGLGVGALIAQPIAASLTVLLITWWRGGWSPGFCLDMRGTRDVIGFSANLLGSNLLNFANRNADDFIVGKVIGSHAAGIYSFAYQIMLYPLGQVSTVIVKVLFPTLSQMKHDLAAFGETYLAAIRFISLVTFPLMLGLFMVADVFVPLVFGEQWLEMIPILKVFCLAGMLQSITTVVGTIFMSTGHVNALFRLSVLQTPVMILGFIVGAYFGLVYVALIYLGLTVVFFFWVHGVAFSFIELRLRQLLVVLWPQLLCAGLMVAVLAVSELVLSGFALPALPWLLLQIPLGAVVYLAATWFLNKEVVAVIRYRLASRKAA
ncbi:MAG: MOP flippase family protein [Gammaproteobacteria bacterium]